MRRIFAFQLLKEMVLAIFWSCWVANLLEEGTSLNQAALIFAIFYFVVAILEVPTGLFADRVGRKTSTVLGLMLIAVGFFLNSMTPKFSGLIGAFCITALGLTLTSGASVAWLLGLVQKRRASFHPDTFFLEMDLIGRLATILGAFLGAYLLQIQPKTMWAATGGIAAIATIVGLCLPEEGRPKASTHFRIAASVWTDLRKPVVVFLIFGSLFFGLETGVRATIYQPYILDLNGGNVLYLAYFQATLALARIVGLLIYRYRFQKLKMGLPLCIAALVFFALAELNGGWANSYWHFLSLYGPAVVAIGWYFPIRDSFFNQHLSETSRATLLSIDSMINKVGSGLACLGLSFAASRANLQPEWFFAGGFLLFNALCLLAAAQKQINRV